ncbi:MAG: alternative ribosome rescue aminoacyl-tRNA hydrolase ArfB [bacterium]
MDTKSLSEKLLPECTFHTSRSSGAGGQHVNKVNTRVELRFDVSGSELLSLKEKSLLMEKLSNRLTREGKLLIASEKTRSQHRNREDCIERFRWLLFEALRPEKKRIPTRPGRRSREKRLETKKQRSQQKQQRKKPEW